jgi:hypothetical protein
MIKPEHDLPVVRQCELLGLARSTAYYCPEPVCEADLVLMRRIGAIVKSGVRGLIRRRPCAALEHADSTVVHEFRSRHCVFRRKVNGVSDGW